MRPFYLAGGAGVVAAAGIAGWLLLRPATAPEYAAAPPAIAPAPAAPAPPVTPERPVAPEPPSAPEELAGVRIDDPRHLACLAQAAADARAALREAQRLETSGALDAGEHCAAAAYLALGEAGEAARRLERLGSGGAAPSQLRAAWLAQAGQAWMMAGDAQRAYGAATLALVLVPNDIDLLIDRAIAVASLGRPFDAIDDLNRAIDLDPARAEAFVFRASAWRQAGRAELAADDIARALALDPGNPEAYLERGMLRRAARDFANARGDFQRAAELAPGTPTEELARAQLAALAAR
ncbi:MAG: tetratricopeptide repeat protein [Acetobacteraceae bacterium]|nr:tetratricopeptide repeat protein [Acetobacteraceae bacterium]